MSASTRIEFAPGSIDEIDDALDTTVAAVVGAMVAADGVPRVAYTVDANGNPGPAVRFSLADIPP